MILAILLSAGASFFFALAETALFSLSKWQVAQFAEKKSGAARNNDQRQPVLNHPPTTGPLFPHLSQLTASDRASRFRR